MKLNTFEIILTNQDAVYFAGHVIQGHVILELAKNTKIKDLLMTCRGKAFVHWTEQQMRGPGEVRFREVRHHSATEVYFDVSRSLLSQNVKSTLPDQARLLEAGQYTYPFKFHIPPASPSSFEGQFGFIRYWVQVTIERPWKKDNSVKKMFSVVGPLDLNQELNASVPIHNRKEKRLCCLCCLSGPITAELRLGQKGYVPGEPVRLVADIDNQSRRKLHNVFVEILMTTTFHTTRKSRSITRPVARIQRGSLPSGALDNWEVVDFILPPLPPSRLTGCSIIDVKYILQLRVFPLGPAFELTVPVEITIGTIPLHSTMKRYFAMYQMALPAAQREDRTRSGVSEMANEYRPLHYLPPVFLPSEMCNGHHVHNDEDDYCLQLDRNYTPRYISYNFQALTPQDQLDPY